MMKIMLAALAALPAYGVVAASLHRRDLASRIEDQSDVSLQGVLDNIGPNGSRAPGAGAGILIASPTTVDPNYFFTWTRDAALTFKMIVDEFLHGNEDLRSYIQDYVRAQAVLQTVSNPSGALYSGRGLGEPKFYVNETRFNGDWGRPQRDGPALRATALITYARWLLSTGDADDASEAKDKIWPVVQTDLNYVAQYWSEKTFDLWEEVLGSSFFTTAAQHRALVEGAALGKKLGHKVDAYESQTPNVLCKLQTYWNGKYAMANMGIEQNRTGVDANTVLASISTFDPEAGCDDTLFQPCSPRALANLKVYVDAFRGIYTINAGVKPSKGVATGRYDNDVYYYGNPWYLTTLAVAEQLYDAIQQWSTLNSITITSVDLAFWQSIYPSAKVGTVKKLRGATYGKSQFNKMLDAVLAFADSFVEVALAHTPADRRLAEQFSRENGTAVSARDLTWSYASFVTMHSARLSATTEYPQNPSWGAPKAPKVPAQCVVSSVTGTYRPATAAGAPEGAGGCTRIITFNLEASTFYGENIYLSGNGSDLGEYRQEDALALSADEYTEAAPLWFVDVELPVNDVVTYQFLRTRPNGTVVREMVNRTYTVPGCEGVAAPGEAVVNTTWNTQTEVTRSVRLF
ncbi:1, 4-alpha-D-glucan glucohydrolase [Polyplosphaeria fusca]|uniref:Glucoamylase n=1 Tax=Polyplosphaeria fusca TaxID=682080 RepID=A0A9P4QTA0_9PLEO|nr:1, 4-alpha-D-glucan glucohydrolase [Polyplosphaeria fusca]